MTTRETLKSFLSSIGSTADSISFKHDTTSNVSQYNNVDLGIDPNTNKELLDVENEGVGLLGDYLNYLTENSENIFKIAAGIEKATASKRGDSLTLPEEQGAENVFVNQGTENFKNLSQYSNSGKFDASGTPIDEFIDKTGNLTNAHNLYTDVEGNNLSTSGETLTGQLGSDQNPQKAITTLLQHHNRFANVFNKTAFAPKGKSSSELEDSNDDSGTIKYENEFGKSNINSNVLGLDKLKELGASLLLKASGYDQSQSPDDSLSYEQALNIFSQGTATSSRFGEESYQKIPVETVRARNAAGAPTDTNGNSLRQGRGEFFGEDPNAQNSFTYGSNYNTEMPFLGKNRKMLKIQAAIASKALIAVTKDFIGTITDLIRFNDLKIIDENSPDTAKQEKSYAGRGPYAKGFYNQIKTFDLDLIKRSLLVKTNFSYPDCLDKGLSVFFENKSSYTVEKISQSNLVSTSPGFWLAVATSILKSFDQITNSFNEINEIEGSQEEKFLVLFEIIKTNKIVNFANAAAIVGDIALKQNNGIKDDLFSSLKKPFDVDSIKTTPGTRVAKSKENDGKFPGRLAWRQSAVPSMYLLPRNILRGTLQLSNLVKGSNPVRAMLGSELVEKTYFDRTHDGTANRIPNDVVKRLEDQLEAEYVPFYIQDLRTNEIIAFHAFLTSLNDTITPNFTQTAGYGRLDPIQTYNNTTRSVTVGFTLMATSKEDYNQMWYKINKLTTLLYPQWTQGTKISTSGEGDSFIMPFSQVLGASPIVRLRVGDVIKSNYSKFALGRLFGIGDPGVNPMVEEDIYGATVSSSRGFLGQRNQFLQILNIVQNVVMEVYYAIAGSPLQYIPNKVATGNKPADAFANYGLSLIRDVIANNLLVNGFVNPLHYGSVMNKLADPNSNFSSGLGNMGGLADPILHQRGRIKGNMVKGYLCDEDGEYYYINRPIECLILENVEGNPLFINKLGKIIKKDTKIYKVKVIDNTNDVSLFNKHLFVSHEDIIPDISSLFTNTMGSLLFIADPLSLIDYANEYLRDTILSTGLSSDAIPGLFEIIAGTEQERFMSARNNPFVRAYESTMGRGLAGTLSNIQFNWLDPDFSWETDYNARAPMGCQISLTLSVIHDIAPGMDHSGYNRAPMYNVGDIMKEASGDVHGNDDNPEYQYKKSNLNYKTGE